MFIRKNKNRKGTVSFHIISKVNGKNRVLKTICSDDNKQCVSFIYQQAKQKMSLLQKQLSLFVTDDDSMIESYLLNIQNAQARTKVSPKFANFDPKFAKVSSKFANFNPKFAKLSPTFIQIVE